MSNKKHIDKHVEPYLIDVEWLQLQRDHSRRWVWWVWYVVIGLLCCVMIGAAVKYGPKDSMYNQMTAKDK